MRFDVPVSGDAQLWGPGHPALYGAALDTIAPSGVQQRDSARIGLRTVTVRDGLLELNGKPVELRGASIQEDVDGHGPALTDADVDADRRPAQGRRRQRHPRALRARRAAAAQARRGRDHGLDPGADLPPRQAAGDRRAARRRAVDRPRRRAGHAQPPVDDHPLGRQRAVGHPRQGAGDQRLPARRPRADRRPRPDAARPRSTRSATRATRARRPTRPSTCWASTATSAGTRASPATRPPTSARSARTSAACARCTPTRGWC